ncbi:hypothetical protein BHM03_00046567 [Ensete ventricosum]|nr:hypothetical protein BHM03_00046567 [Ensete ventricosum]
MDYVNTPTSHSLRGLAFINARAQLYSHSHCHSPPRSSTGLLNQGRPCPEPEVHATDLREPGMHWLWRLVDLMNPRRMDTAAAAAAAGSLCVVEVVAPLCVGSDFANLVAETYCMLLLLVIFP